MTKKAKNTADKILLGWLCAILLQLILFSIISSKAYVQFPYLLGLEIPLPFLHGPFLFLYTKSLTSPRVSSRKEALHFIPYGIAFISIIPFLLLEKEEKIYVYQNEGEGFILLSSIILLGIILSGITYIVLSLRTLIEHKKCIKATFSYTEKINLEWLYRLIIGLSFIWVLVIFADDEIIFISVVLFVIFIGYYGIKQVGIFTNQAPQEWTPVLESSEKTELQLATLDNVKYENSLLSDEKLQDIDKRLEHLMRENKLYLTPELTLAMVSQKIEVHPNTLSQVINSVKQKNFFDYINELRIEELKERIAKLDHQKYTLLSIAYDCGFNSKTSFNRNFKNYTGKSPSEYLKDVKTGLN